MGCGAAKTGYTGLHREAARPQPPRGRAGQAQSRHRQRGGGSVIQLRGMCSACMPPAAAATTTTCSRRASWLCAGLRRGAARAADRRAPPSACEGVGALPGKRACARTHASGFGPHTNPAGQQLELPRAAAACFPRLCADKQAPDMCQICTTQMLLGSHPCRWRYHTAEAPQCRWSEQVRLAHTLPPGTRAHARTNVRVHARTCARASSSVQIRHRGDTRVRSKHRHVGSVGLYVYWRWIG